MDQPNQKSEDNACEYAETALEHYMKKCFQFEEENKELREQIKRLMWMIQEHD